jgi:exoribonuclease II
MQTVKMVDASQARSINRYLNIKHKLLNCNAINRTCKELKVVQKYAKTKIKLHKIKTEHLTDKIQRVRIYNEKKIDI